MKLKTLKEYLKDVPYFLHFYLREKIRTLKYYNRRLDDDVRNAYEIGGRILLEDE